jgi:hypothetical protein
MTVTIPGTVSRDDIVGISSNDKIGSSLCLSFDNDKVFISSNTYNSDAGLLRIYESTGAYNFNWNLLATLNGNSNDDFGHSIDATWDGDILCVGAPGNNKIYIYEDTSGSKNWSSYVSNSISGNSNSEFGFSVSINKDTGNNIAVGVPGENTVNVIQKVGGTWSSSWSNTWTTSLFRNYIYENSGATGTQTLLYINETSTGGSPRYGHSVSISGYGNYLAVGAPGEIISGNIGLDVSNVYYTNGTQPSSFTRSGEGTLSDKTHTRPFDTAALGHVVCYKTSNVLSDWRTHSSVSQYGPVIRGHTADDTDTMPQTHEPSHSWGFPACGKRVQMSVDGSKVMAGSPHYAKAGKHSFSSGKIEGWEYNDYDNTWVLGKAPLVGGGERRLGQDFILDYAGTRAVSCTRKNNGGNGEVLVTDFNGTGWYEVVEGIPFNSFTGPSGIHTSNGKLIAVADPQDDGNKGRIRFYDFPLTQIIEGNTLASGYIAADSLRIGSNDNAVNDNVPKRISFGGTYQDNEYHMTEIENRSFYYDELNTDVDLQGNSELIFMKKSTGDMPDMIRMKSNEFRIDNYVIGDGDYDHTPRLTMDNVGNFKLNAEMSFNSERGQADIKALLDIEGDCFTRRRLNAGLSTGNDSIGVNKYPFNILYDTRTSLVKNNNNGTGLVSNVTVWNRGVAGQSMRWNTNGPISGTINYHATEGAISLNTNNSYSQNTGQHDTIFATNGSNLGGFKISFWIKLQNAHSTYSTKTLVGVGTLATSGVTGCRVQITNDRIQMNFGQYQIHPSSTYTFETDIWYHIWVQSDPVGNAGTGNSIIKINDVSLGLSSTGTVANGFSTDKKFYIGSSISSDSATDIYIGNIAFYPARSSIYYGSPENPTSTDMYNWAPPEQKLAVGGQAYIQTRLGVNKFSPAYEIDVDGTISSSNVVLAGGSSVESTPYYFTVIVNGSSKFEIDGTQQPTLTLYRGVTYRFDQSSSTNGSHPFRISTTAEGSQYTSGSSYNGSNGSSGAYRQFIVPLDAPDTMYYNCSSHSSMGGTLRILSGIVTTSGVASSNVFVNNHMGIGTYSPTAQLHVKREGSSVGINTSSPEVMLHVKREGSTGESNVYIQSYSDAAGDRAALFLGTPHVTGGTAQPKCAIIADTIGWSRANLHFCLETTQNNGSAYRASTSNSRMMIDGTSGNVGISTTSPTQAKLVVSGAGTSTNIGAYALLNSSAATDIVGSTEYSGEYYSIHTTHRIACSEINLYSDSRIKKNVVDINDSSALDKISLLKPKIYNYIDEKQRGTSNVYGFIAQEVANVLPYAVTVGTGDIPNILTNSNVSVTSDSNVLELRLDTTVEGLTLSNTSNINITTDKNKYLTVPVLTFSGSNVITIQNNQYFNNVTGAYIHGEQVSNFHHLNKDAIWAVSTAALQEVDRQLQAEKTKVADLLARVTALENN